MTRLFLITLLLLSSSPAYAEWVKAIATEVSTVYMDPETIRRKGNLVKVWGLKDYKTVQGAGAISYLSIKELNEFDCTEEQVRTLAEYVYSGQMGNGEIVYSNKNPDKWEPIMPGSMGQTQWKFACGRK